MGALNNELLGGKALNGPGAITGAPRETSPKHAVSQNTLIARSNGGSVGYNSQRREADRDRPVDSELNQIALAIEDLQDRLDKANARLGNVAQFEATELEIGRLLVDAQRSSDSVLTHLESKVHEVLILIENKARQILLEATEEAHHIRRQAQQSALSATQTARDLHAALVAFASANADVLAEYGGLNTMLDSALQAHATQAIDEDAALAPDSSGLGPNEDRSEHASPMPG